VPTPRAAGQGTGWPSAAGAPPVRGLALQGGYMGTAQGAGAVRVVIPPDPGEVLAPAPQGHYSAARLWQPAGGGAHLPAEG
jgi:hypothetical protein